MTLWALTRRCREPDFALSAIIIAYRRPGVPHCPKDGENQKLRCWAKS
ncbi:unnamed protein product, partial [marine sediment metagenome]